MSLVDIFSYYTALVAIAIAPGPLMILLMTRAASNDLSGAVGFAFGTALGSLTILSAVCFGMSVWLADLPEVLNYSKFLMILYILWVAYGMWRNGLDLSREQTPSRTGAVLAMVTGFLTCVSSPYMLILFPLLLPEIIDMTTIVMPDFLLVTGVTFLAEATAAALMIGLAAQLRRLVHSPRAVQIMNRSLATILVILGGGMAIS